MWILFLNDMRSSNIEITNPVFSADNRDELVALIRREKVESYTDGQWGKCYRRGGPLEWFNAPGPPTTQGFIQTNDYDAPEFSPDFFGQGIHDVGSQEDAAERGRELWQNNYGHLPRVTGGQDGGR